MQKEIIITVRSSGILKAGALPLINEGHNVYGIASKWAIGCLVSRKQIGIGSMELYPSPGSQSIGDSYYGY